ncbi:MAG TPA: aminopeptidase P family protein, partial [Candidatus Bathyarchaeota archaeon]|nr:aminopeptidase P family protein [Candidatus Bathyarchaeota archaeon]
MYSDSSKDANMYYLTQFVAPDAFIYLKKIDQEPTIVVSQMEYSRAQKQSTVKNVNSYFDYNYQQVVKSVKNPQLGG